MSLRLTVCLRVIKRLSFLVILAASLLSSSVRAQITNVGDTTSTPVAGVGHDYIHLISETVNPANGSLSLRIQVPMPPGRGLTIPFSFDYDSNGTVNLQYEGNGITVWTPNTSQGAVGSSGGWGYSLPQASMIYVNDGSPGYPCSYGSNYVFQDPSGGRHALYLETAGYGLVPGGGIGSCGENILSGGDGPYTATTPTNSYGSGVEIEPLAVSDPDGTIFYFGFSSSNAQFGTLPQYAEDRNGNKVGFSWSGNTFSMTDTANRTALSSSGFGAVGTDTLTVAGLSSPYQIVWEKVPAQYNLSVVNVTGYKYCGFPGVNTNLTVIKSITLPNGQQYSFTYDPTFGLIRSITYPDGGWVLYTWKLSDNVSELAIISDAFGNVENCSMEYTAPVLASRTVGYSAGSSAALDQGFTYFTNWPTGSGSDPKWTQKTTTVTTRDAVQNINQSAEIVYTYTGVNVPPQPTEIYVGYGSEIPLESSIEYYDFGGSSPIRTVNKTWFPNIQHQLQSQQTVLNDANNLAAQTTYTYTGTTPGAQVLQKTDYDFGASSPTRITKYAYQAFPGAPGTILDRPSSVIIDNGSGTRIAETDYTYDKFAVGSASATQHDENLYKPSASTPRANVSLVTQQCFPSCSNSVTSHVYDETGQVTSTTDPCGNSTCSDMIGTNHTTNYLYTDNYTSCGGAAPSSNTNAYVTTSTDPLGHSRNYCYGYNDGQLRSTTDPNGQVTSYAYTDPLGRITSILNPDSGETSFAYNDAPPSPTVTTTLKRTFLASLVTISTMGGMGHVTQDSITSDPSGTDYTVTTYNGEGLPISVTNPYRSASDPTYGVTNYLYDALGRIKTVTNPDNTTVLTSYAGRATRITDEGNGTRSLLKISQTDAFGSLVAVCEISSVPLTVGTSATPVACGQDIAGTGFLTSYSYDPLGNQLSVTQGNLNPRTWSYDSLSRLRTSVNPESGSATYTYDVSGNVSSKVTPKQNQTSPSITVSITNQFDVTNRIVKRTYSDGTTPAENFWYDTCPTSGCPSGFTLTNAVGRLVESFTSNTGEFESYDSMGRKTSDYQCTPQNCGSTAFPLIYGYDLLGELASSTNGFGVTITNIFNSIGQLTSVESSLVDANHPATFLSGALYTGTGQFSSATRWGLTTAGMQEGATYDTRLRLTTFAERYFEVHGGHYEYGYHFTPTYAPNGDLLSVTDTANGYWNYTYDDFNRLLSATGEPTGSPAYSYVYDRYGNRWDQFLGGNCTAGTTFCSSFDSNNHVNNGTLTYDAAGNVLSDSAHHYTYDAENRLTSVDAGTTATYIYDALGRRVRKTTAGLSVDYLYDLSNRPVSQVSVPTSGVGTWTRSEVFSGARHLATYAGGSGGTTYATFSDPLVGTERVRISSASICESILSLPFGDGQTTGGSCGDPSPLHFAGKERDTESGLDNFGARYNASALGRFMSPDPESVGADLKNPQSWNGYSYVDNDPLNSIDPSGLSCVSETGDSGCTEDQADITGNVFEATEVAQQGGQTPQDKDLPLIPRPIKSDTYHLYDTGFCKASDRACQQQLSRILDDLRWWKAGVKSFFSPSEQLKEWKPGGCVAVGFDAFVNGGIIPDFLEAPPGFGVDDAVKQGAATAAMVRTVSRGLVVPLRSRYIQRAVMVGEVADGVAVVDLLRRSGQALTAESQAMAAGKCR